MNCFRERCWVCGKSIKMVVFSLNWALLVIVSYPFSNMKNCHSYILLKTFYIDDLGLPLGLNFKQIVIRILLDKPRLFAYMGLMFDNNNLFSWNMFKCIDALLNVQCLLALLLNVCSLERSCLELGFLMSHSWYMSMIHALMC